MIDNTNYYSYQYDRSVVSNALFFSVVGLRSVEICRASVRLSSGEEEEERKERKNRMKNKESSS